jgi:hypothetical protein
MLYNVANEMFNPCRCVFRRWKGFICIRAPVSWVWFSTRTLYGLIRDVWKTRQRVRAPGKSNVTVLCRRSTAVIVKGPRNFGRNFFVGGKGTLNSSMFKFFEDRQLGKITSKAVISSHFFDGLVSRTFLPGLALSGEKFHFQHF